MLVITPQRHDRAIERLTRAIRVGSSSGSLRCAKARSWQHLLDMTVEERAPIAVIDPYWGG